MRQKSGPEKQPAEDAIRDIRRATRRHFSAEEKIRVVLEGLRGEESIAELCRREGAIPWILGSGYHRNARNQSERGVPPNVMVRCASERPLSKSASAQHSSFDAGAIDCPRSDASIDRHRLPAAMMACQKSIPSTATTIIRRIRARVSRPKVLSSWEVSRSGSLIRKYSVGRQRADLTRH